MIRRIPLYQGFVDVVANETIFTGKVFKMNNLTERHQRFDGTITNKFTWTICRRKPSAAVLIHHVPTDEIVLVEQFRPATLLTEESTVGVPFTTSGRTLELVAGGLGEDTPEVCIRREALEEAGIQLDRVLPMPSFFPSPGGCDEFIYMFYAPVFSKAVVPGTGGGLIEENENTLLHWVKYRSALSMCLSGEILDGKTQNGILMGNFVRCH